jgi:hypothetical protein
VDGNRKIVGVDIYSPDCGHPLGVTFAAGLSPSPWPAQSAFYQLDSHSHTVSIQRAGGQKAGMALNGIDVKANHCLSRPRPIGGKWDLLVSIPIGPDAWTSGDTVAPETTDSSGKTVPCFIGKDAPTDQVSSMQTLTFLGVTSAELLGAPGNVQALLPSPWSGQGTLIFEDEVPYVPTLQHERAAISAMADLAGLDLALNYPLPRKSPGTPIQNAPVRPMLHSSGYCGHSLIVMPS